MRKKASLVLSALATVVLLAGIISYVIAIPGSHRASPLFGWGIERGTFWLYVGSEYETPQPERRGPPKEFHLPGVIRYHSSDWSRPDSTVFEGHVRHVWVELWLPFVLLAAYPTVTIVRRRLLGSRGRRSP